MSKESVDVVVTQTMATINADMAALHGAPTVQQVEGIMRAAITHAYSQVEADDKQYLYRQLSRKFHPDRLLNSTELFAARLANDDALKVIPQQVLQQVHTNQDLLNQFVNNPMEASQSILQQFMMQFDVELEQYNRYIAPIATMVYLTQAVINTAIILAAIAGLVAVIGSVIALSIMKYLEKTLLNLLTTNQLDRELDQLVTPELLAKIAEAFLPLYGVDTSNVQDDAEMIQIFLRVMETNGISNSPYARLSLASHIF